LPTLKQFLWHPKARKAILAASGVLCLLFLLAFAFPQAVLCIDSAEAKADVLVVLGGGYQERATRALELFRAGVAPKIILTGMGDCQEHQRFLIAQGVPADLIQIEPNSKSTKENAQFTIPLLRAAGAQHVIIVTSWYHSRRALKCFRHYAPDIQFSSRPSLFGIECSQWSRAGLTKFVRLEYLKLPGYWVCYGVCPF
jgi:uncharacterized SAM-binding protein YcdF (DUF218 family)